MASSRRRGSLLFMLQARSPALDDAVELPAFPSASTSTTNFTQRSAHDYRPCNPTRSSTPALATRHTHSTLHSTSHHVRELQLRRRLAAPLLARHRRRRLRLSRRLHLSHLVASLGPELPRHVRGRALQAFRSPKHHQRSVSGTDVTFRALSAVGQRRRLVNINLGLVTHLSILSRRQLPGPVDHPRAQAGAHRAPVRRSAHARHLITGQEDDRIRRPVQAGAAQRLGGLLGMRRRRRVRAATQQQLAGRVAEPPLQALGRGAQHRCGIQKHSVSQASSAQDDESEVISGSSDRRHRRMIDFRRYGWRTRDISHLIPHALETMRDAYRDTAFNMMSARARRTQALFGSRPPWQDRGVPRDTAEPGPKTFFPQRGSCYYFVLDTFILCTFAHLAQLL